MKRTYNWAPIDPMLRALPPRVRRGTLLALARQTGVPYENLRGRRKYLRLQATPPRRHPRWTATDDARVTAVLGALAQELARTPGAIATRALLLGGADDT